jgi:hypothetical protein
VPEHVGLKPGAEEIFKDAVRSALEAWDERALGRCPKPTITVSVPEGDPHFQGATALAQIRALEALLNDASRFEFKRKIEGTAYNVVIDASATDQTPP